MADIESAKAYLLKASSNTGTNLYDHLASVLKTILDEKKDDAFSGTNLEDLSSEIKTDRHMETTTIQSDPDPLAQVALATTQEQLFKPSSVDNFDDEDAEVEPVIPNMMEQSQYFEDAGLGLGREETFRVLLALKQLQTQESFSKIRFWGKILGIKANYLIAECQYTGGDAFSPDGATGADVDDDEDEEGKSADDDVPESQYQAPMVVPSESYASGVNKYVYYVCNEAGSPWIRLPHATPRHIVVARQIRRFFTGDLTAPVPSYPPFPGGTEAHLLRAQLAEITAKCSISPEGFYQEGEETDEGAKSIEAVDKETFVESYNPTLDNFKDLSFWKHHELLLNAIGRCQQIPANDDDEDAPEIEQPEPLPVNPSVTDPVVLGPDEAPAWTLRACPAAAGESPNSLVIATSQQWPGAFAAAYGKKYVNFYCGFGVAASTGAVYQPPKVPAIQAEWAPEGEDEGLVEQKDEITEPVAEADDEEEA